MRISKSLIFIFIFVSVTTIIISNQLLKEKVELLKQEKYLSLSKKMQEQTKILIDEKRNATSAIGITLAVDKTLKEALQRNKPQLLRLDELALSLRNNNDFKHVWFQIITNEGKSFYRSWVKKRGDSVLKARIDIVEILKNPKMMATISVGKFDMTFKSMIPIYHRDNLLGILEVITHFNSIAQKILKQGIEPIILVDKKYKSQITKPFTKLFIGDYYVANLNASPKHMDWIKQKNIHHFLNFERNYHEDKENGNLITMYNLPDIYNKPMGYFILIKPINEIDMSEIDQRKEKMTLYIFTLIILFAYIFYYFANKKYISEISSKNIETDRLNSDLEKNKNEIQLINKNLELKVTQEIEKNREKENILMEQSKLAQMGDMLNMIAHQWRQPLNAMSASAIKLSMENELDMLDKDGIDDMSKFIQEETQIMSKIINDFMAFNKPEKNDTFLLFDSVTQVVNMISPQLKNRNITLEVEVAREIKVFHNSKSIEHTLLNLIMNSRDAFEGNKIKDKRIKIFTTSNEDFIALHVEDNAGGIPADIIDKIFNPYFTTKEQGKGTGIGLYMSKQMVESIDGSAISVEVINGHTLFTIKFGKNE